MKTWLQGDILTAEDLNNNFAEAIAAGTGFYGNNQYTFSNTTYFSANVVLANNKTLTANGTAGSSGQVLTSNGTGVYWQTLVGVNTNFSYIFANTISFTGNVVISNTINANGSVGSNGYVLTSGGPGQNVYWVSVSALSGDANNALYLGGVAANAYVNSVQLSANLSNYQTSAGLSANVAKLTSNSALFANNATYLNGVAATSYVNSSQLTANLSNYVAVSDLTLDVSRLTANNANNLGGQPAANYVNTSQLSTNLINYQTTAGLSGNVATLTANNANYLGGSLAAKFVQNTDSRTLSGNLTFSGQTVFSNITTFNANVFFYGNVTTVSANNFVISDNMIYLNNGSQYTNPDIGLASNYNDGTYHHTGIFRDHSDAYWKVFDNYTPEPDASQFIDTSHATFHIANFQANTGKFVSLAANGSIGSNNTYLTSNSTGGIFWNSLPPRYINMVQPGTVRSPYTGTARYYPPASITISNIIASVSQAITSTNLTFLIYKNGVSIGTTFSINIGQNIMTPVSVSVSLAATDYLTLSLTAGSAVDLRVQMQYTYN